LGWFVAGAATATGAVAAGAVALRRLRGPGGDELPAAVGFDEVMWAEPEAPPAAAEDATAIPVRPVADDERAAELRTRIAESRRRLRAKTKAATGETRSADDGDEEPTSEH
jgi:hypothetical protein